MSAEAIQSGDYGGGYSSYLPRILSARKENRGRSYVDPDPYAKAALIIDGEIVCTGKAAIREFEARRRIREDEEAFFFATLDTVTSPAKTTTSQEMKA